MVYEKICAYEVEEQVNIQYIKPVGTCRTEEAFLQGILHSR